MEFDIYEILKYMPHRYPFLLVDRILKLTEKEVVGLKNVTFNEEFFQGHFPEKPVMPGVLIVEAMAQTGGFLLLNRIDVSKREDYLLYFAGIDKVKFRKPVVPGDQLIMKLELVRFGGQIAKMTGVAEVNGTRVAEGEFLARLMEK